MANYLKIKLNEAKDIVLRCVGKNGIYAGTLRYRHQCWTRDLSYSIDALLSLGQAKTVRKHLLNIAKKQKKSGKVPIMYITSYFGFLRIHAHDLFTHKRRFIKQVLLYARHFNPLRFSFQNITPWTTDGEMLFIIASMRYYEKTHDCDFIEKIYSHLERALEFTETHNMNKDGFVVGGDWRDVMVDLKDAVLLINNVLLYRAYVVMCEKKKAEALKKRINNAFWTGSYYRDRLGSEDFDTLGQSWAVLYDIVPSARYASVSKKYLDVDSAHGLRVNDNAPDSAVVDASIQVFTDQYGTIWPFVTGSGILALIKMKSATMVVEQVAKWTELKGFYEWYNASDGSGLGDCEQLWSAALYITVCERLAQNHTKYSYIGLSLNDYLETVPTINLSAE